MTRRSEVDVVVVGAGAAGCVMAARLARERRVLLLEAGPDLRNAIPAGLRDGWGLDRGHYWGTESEPDTDGTVRAIPRCRLVGGTSWMTRFALRGSPADFEEWSSIGNPGWGFDEVLPYFIRLETDLDFPNSDYHGAAGPLPVNRYLAEDRMGVHEASVWALQDMGIAAVEDHNRPGAVGVGRMPMNSVGGSRRSVADAYLPMGHSSSSLTIRGGATAARLVIDGTRVRGVELIDGEVIAADLVVVSAGTIASPAILMRSGIGPADHLRSMGIEVVTDLQAVGQGLGDHPAADLDCGYRGPSRRVPALHSIATFHSRGTGADEAPDLMLWLADPDDDGFFISAVLLKPTARGVVRLRSADAKDPPVVELPTPMVGHDLDRLVEGYRLALELANHSSLKRWLRPGIVTDPTDDAIVELIRGNYSSVPHYVGTCAMGPESSSVVDAAGRVHGVEGVFVVDASIIPIVPSGFTHLPTVMAAERLSDQLSLS